ncbi:LamG-like jellyroll fold domain-containing protein [Adhaeribacter terreus]|uniref:LamG-like jellyroll fold domain-containing protein n=1 Tax=Adhaeribacter terreus TaxID=529703 RepID=A0ABW0EAM2_9BACT
MRKYVIFAILGLLFVGNCMAQFPSKTNLASLSISANTREKPQSKVWMHDGRHWTVLSNSSGAHVWRLDGNAWTRVLTISSSSNLRADCKVVGNIVHVFLFRGNSSDLVSIEYVPSNSTYKLWSGRTSTVRVTTDSDAETATIDIDSNGRMWVAYDNNSSILVRWSDAPYSSWSSPITVASNINDDDIGAVIAFPMFNKIGVLWSNQDTERWGFKMHTDGASPSSWSSDENPASQSALNKGAGFADDHLNMKVASDGTLYCAVKTGYDSPGYTKITLLVRRPNGTWDDAYKVSELGTRGIVILNEAANKIRVVYTETEDGGDIYYRESAFSPISFGSQHTLISGNYNNATSIKTNYTSDVVILASTSSTAVGVLASDGGTTPPLPGTPTLAAPANNATGIATNPTLSWNAASNATSYQLQVATSNSFSAPLVADVNTAALSNQVTGLSNNTQHFWRVRAINQTGTSAWSSIRNFTTVASPASRPDTVLLASPANNAINVALPAVLSWNAATNATSYQLQVATASNFQSPEANISNITTLSRSVTGLANNTQYFWRVKAFNASGESNWSAVRSFKSEPMPLPGTPTLASPADNATGISINPTLSWNAASNATSYQLQVAISNSFSAPLVEDISNISTLSRTISGLANNTQYSWRVKAFNASGESNWSASRSFTTLSQSSPPVTGLVAHWEMEDVGGMTLTDATANGNHATTVGNPTKVTGIYGQALQLNGSSQYATAPSSASLNVGNALTLAAWIRPSRSGSRQVVLKKGTTADGYELGLTGSRRIIFTLNEVSADGDFKITSSDLHPIDGTTWMHIAATYDGATMKLYLNGTLEKSETVDSPSPINSNNQPFSIGAKSDGGSRLQGTIDDARVYNVALNATEISALAALPNARTAAASPPEPTGQTDTKISRNHTSSSKVKFIVPAKGDYTITLYDLSGRPIRVLQQGYAESRERLSVDLKDYNLPDGIYMVKLFASKSNQTYLRVKVGD